MSITQSIERIEVIDIDSWPTCEGLEVPLHPRRKRRWSPPATARRARPPKPPPLPPPSSSPPVMSTEVVVEVIDYVDKRSPPSSPSVLEPSSAIYADYKEASTSSQSLRTPRKSLRAAWAALSYGSETDSGGSDNEDGFEAKPCFIQTACLSALLSPEDDEEDDIFEPTATDDAATAGVSDAAADSTSGDSDPPPSATHLPRSLYDFDWRPFPKAPISPASRRESFSDINVGPTIPSVDPYDIFINIWDQQFMEYIASETNRYAQQMAASMLDDSHILSPNSRIGKWKETTADELYVFFALIIGMGIVVKSRVEEYWGGDADLFYTPGFSKYMGYSRFLILQRCLHFANSEDMCGLELTDSEAKLFKIQPVLSHLNNRFQSLYRLKQNIALDESLLLWKGRLDISQSIPNKVASMGIKSYEICESQTGYLWRFEIHAYSRKSLQREGPLNASTPAMVLELIQGLEGKGHTLWMDNFYNSPCLARQLKSVGVDCVGTLRTNRKFVPQALHSLTANNMADGEITGLTSGDVDIMVWKDNSRVGLISTYHGNAVSRVHGTTKPILVHDYNIMMGGVDKKDQLLSMYPIERKRTKVWYKKLFRRLLNVSILNSYIIHRQTSSSSSTPPLSHRQFRKALVKSLLSNHDSRLIPKKPGAVNLLRPTKADLHHRLVQYPFTGKQRRRRYCVKCRKLVNTYCQGCEKTVCMEPCFLSLHI